MTNMYVVNLRILSHTLLTEGYLGLPLFPKDTNACSWIPKDTKTYRWIPKDSNSYPWILMDSNA